MHLLIRLGLKNIGRNRLRSALTILAVMLCSGGLTFYGIFFAGVMDMFLKAFTEQIGHVRLIHTELAKKKRLGQGQYFVKDLNKLVTLAKKQPGVQAVVPRIDLGAFIDHKGKQAPGRGIGVDPEAERKVMRLHEKLVKGRMFKPKKKEILLGVELAKRLKAKIGSSIVLMGKTVDDSMSALRMKVVGLLNLGTPAQNKTFIISLPMAQYMLDIDGQATSVLVFAGKFWEADKVAAHFKKMKLPPKIYAQAWTESDLAAYLVPLANIMLFVLGGIIVFIGAIGLLNTMTMSVLERKSEVGIMMALGMSPERVAAVFLFEGAVFGAIGAIGGVGLALIGAIPIVTKGISFPADALSKFPMAIPTTLKGAYSTEVIIIGLLVGVLCTVFGSLWPAFKASRMEPVDSLRQGA